MISVRVNLPSVLKNELIEYPTPSTLNYFWSFGSLSGIFLVVQLVSGIILAMYFTTHADMAFTSVEHIMRDVNFGWLLRYFHSNGASFFFLVVYLHMARGLFYMSYIGPKYRIWVSGMIIYAIMMGTAFLGYVLPWGQMSYWAATVITNIITALPFGDGGESFSNWLWGSFSVDNPTLNRFFSFHYVFPFLLACAVIVHIFLLHEVGSTEPFMHSKNVDVIRFYPYFLTKDLFALLCIFIIFLCFIIFGPNFLGHPDNYVAANPLVTPKHIVPEWYFLPFYGLLRSIPNKYLGIALMAGALIMLIVLPYLTYHDIMHLYFNGSTYGLWTSWYISFYRFITILFFMNFFVLGWLGANPVEPLYMLIGLFSTAFYYIFFILVYVITYFDKYYFFNNIPEPEEYKDDTPDFMKNMLNLELAQRAGLAPHPKRGTWAEINRIRPEKYSNLKN